MKENDSIFEPGVYKHWYAAQNENKPDSSPEQIIAYKRYSYEASIKYFVGHKKKIDSTSNK
jgi:hypothetical protein